MDRIPGGVGTVVLGVVLLLTVRDFLPANTQTADAENSAPQKSAAGHDDLDDALDDWTATASKFGKGMSAFSGPTLKFLYWCVIYCTVFYLTGFLVVRTEFICIFLSLSVNYAKMAVSICSYS